MTGCTPPSSPEPSECLRASTESMHDFSPPVLRPPSRLLASSPAPSGSSPGREGRPSLRVSLVYDQVLHCYFDPVSHRYFELC